MLAFALSSAPAFAGGLPGRSHFVAGQGAIAKSGGVLTIDQTSRTGIVNWKSFSVGKSDSVVFENGHGATLNIVNSGNLSRIAGDLHGTGSVYLLNRAGVVVGKSGVIDTQGSFVASSRNADSGLFSDDKRLHLIGNAKGNVVNRGNITATGLASLSGGRVANSGTISSGRASLVARHGLYFSGRIDAKRSVETSGHHVRLDGGNVTANHWLVDPVNLTVDSAAAGTIDSSLNGGTDVTLQTTSSGASGPGNQSAGPGDIIIGSGIEWTTNAKLTLDAYHGVRIAAPVSVQGTGGLAITTNDGGSGGELIFSAASVTFAHTASKLTIGGNNYTLEKGIGSAAADILANGGNGFYALVNDVDTSAKTWNQAPISTFYGAFEGLGHTITGLKVADNTASGYDGLFSVLQDSSSVRDLDLQSVDVEGGQRASAGGLAGINYGSISRVVVSGAVASGKKGNAGGLVGTNSGQIASSRSGGSVSVFVPSGTKFVSPIFSGGLVGLNRGAIVRSSSQDAVLNGGGLVGENAAHATITNSHAGGTVRGTVESEFGGLVARNFGTIDSSYATGAVFGKPQSNVGGLAGLNFNNNGKSEGVISNSYATGNVKAGRYSNIGGLVGEDLGPVSNSHATGNVVSGALSRAGGLVGDADNPPIVDSYATGTVTAGDKAYVGGLVGYSLVDISDGNASGAVKGGNGSDVGGLVGYGENILISNSSATQSVSGGQGSYVGGLVGLGSGEITASSASGNVSGGDDAYVGGLVGENLSRSITGSHATGDVVAGDNAYVGGLIGLSGNSIADDSYATGSVTGGDDDYAGGLIGATSGSSGSITVGIDSSYATGAVNVGVDSAAGGLVGKQGSRFDILRSFANGNVVGKSNSVLGGLLGMSLAKVKIFYDYATGNVRGGTNATVGGFAGRSRSNVRYAYSIGKVRGGAGATVGGFVGSDESINTIASSYWDLSNAGVSAQSGAGNILDAPGITGLTTTQFKSGLPTGFDSGTWGQDSSINRGFPYLLGNPPP